MEKRLFIGMEVKAPWPEQWPEGRVLLEKDRHLTLAFLGEVSLEKLLPLLNDFPKPSFEMGIGGVFDRPLFLPHRMARVAAWRIQFLEKEEQFLSFQKNLSIWLKGNEFPVKEKGEFLPHVTIARAPFKKEEWKKSFESIPLYLKNIHLYESLGSSKYEILWSCPTRVPFEEIEHTADIAFLVTGCDLSQLYLHAQLALSFHFPPFISFFDLKEVHSWEEIVSGLNERIFLADAKIGCPFKAVSFHGAIERREFLEWEMIVDV